MKIQHLLINPHEDSMYPITWVSKNINICKIDRNYTDSCEFVLNKAIFIKLPNQDNINTWYGYAANDEGWLSTCDATGNYIDQLPEISIIDGILEVEKEVNKWQEKYENNTR